MQSTNSPTATSFSISTAQIQSLRASGHAKDLIDVRSPDEYETVHAQGARLVPLDTLDAEQVTQFRAGSEDEPIYFICKSGKRAAKACEHLREQGFENVRFIEGGTDAWLASGLPVVKGRRVMTMQRQTQLGAGLIVLTGAILGFTVHPGFYGLCAFVGAGLTFAGLSGTCGMAMVLELMPWNHRTAKSSSGGSCSSGCCSKH